MDYNRILEIAISLSFAELRTANLARCVQFKDAKGRLCHPDGVNNWQLSQWSNAAAGEMGEACNVIKKIERGDFPLDDITKEMLGKEVADVVTYLDLLAARAGIDLGKAVRDKFNEVSRRVGSEVTL